MTQPYRLAVGGRIDRSKPLEFSFNGKPYQGYQGDTLASALLANGVRVVARSFKYHRPRGIVGSGSEEPNAIVQLGSGTRALPNYLATQIELYNSLSAKSVNCWPNVDLDVRAITDILSRFMPPGFYYKTFMWPKGFWHRYEHNIRKAGGYGISPKEPDVDRYDTHNARCDVLIIGGGPAGLAAALEAGRTGARVIIVDEQNEFGGSLMNGHELINGLPAMEWVTTTVEELISMNEVQLLVRSTAFGYYDHNFIGIIERVTDHLLTSTDSRPRQRLWRIRANQIIIAAGAIERPLVFSNNDRPGIMLASATSSYLNRFAVTTGSQAVIFTNNDSAYQTALDLALTGIQVTAVVDVRHDPNGALPTQVRQNGIAVIAGHAIVNVRGTRLVKGVEISRLDSSGESVIEKSRLLPCDLVSISGGWNPTIHLYSQSGGHPLYNKTKGCFIPGKPVQAERSAGSCNGAFTLGECLAEGFTAGATAAHISGFGNGHTIVTQPVTSDPYEEPMRPMWIVPSSEPAGHGPKQFVDPQTDTSASDILVAVREGYESIEHVKRYTTLGMGSDQGKLGSVNGIGILAKTLNVDMNSIGTTTFRPAYTPITYGAIAGRNIGYLADPVRKTALHQWHVEAGAEFENVGQWKRPWYYPRKDESMHDAVSRECLAVRNNVGVVDASTLGKIDVKGPDAIKLLNRVYTNSWNKLEVGHCRYGFMLSEDGMLLDDGVTARLGENHYLMHTTTGGALTVMSWLERWLQTEWSDLKVYLTSVTDHWTTVSLNGPNSRNVIAKICNDIDFSSDAFPFMSTLQGTIMGIPARVFRISFSGELSYEINISANYGRVIWEAAMKAGKEYDITPYGTEAMHVLRAEKGFVIIGQDTDGSLTPIDLGMDWIISKYKKDFLGRRSLSREDTVRADRKQLVGLLTTDPYEVLPEGGQIVENPTTKPPIPMIGHVTSSYFSAYLGRSIALGVIKSGLSRIGEKVYIPLPNGQIIEAMICNPQFYDSKGTRQNV